MVQSRFVDSGGDHGLLPADSAGRLVNRELFVLLGGTAALLMQVAHPLVAAGVAGHSDFARHPIRRLRRTLDTTLAVVFGDRAGAEAALGRIDRRHGPVVGTAGDGRPYAARDPLLLLWVQATLVLTSLRLYELVAGRLPPARREAYWAEARPIAARLGIPADLLPPTLADLERFEATALAADVRPDATATAVGRQVLRPFRLPAPLYWLNDALTAALVPPSLRAPFGLRYRTRERMVVQGIVIVVRSLRRVLPARLTTVPQARRYEARHAR